MNKLTQVLQLFLEKHNARIDYKMDFPMYRILPDEVKLALKVLAKHGMKVVITIKENKALASK